MSKRKKTFTCGHKGYGQQCHRCAQAILTQAKTAQSYLQKQRQKQEWQASFELDPIDLTDLPKHIVLKTRTIIESLQTQNYVQLGGKRLRHNRTIISIPINRDYRLICRDCGSTLIPQEVLSHEEYNVCKPGG